MSNVKNSAGRPKIEGLNNNLKFSVDDQTASDIKSLSEETSKSQAQILRELAYIASSKEFESMIPNVALEHLQSLSEKCWNILHTDAAIFQTKEISDSMPAFVTTWKPAYVHVKYPTYKIQIFNGSDVTKSTNQEDLEKLLSGVSMRSRVYATKADFVVDGAQMLEMQYHFVSEVTCLSVNLTDNISTKDNIVSILNEHGYYTSVYGAYCLRSAPAELLEDNKYFKVLS